MQKINFNFVKKFNEISVVFRVSAVQKSVLYTDTPSLWEYFAKLPLEIYGPSVFLSRPGETLQKGTLIKLSDEKLFTSQTASEKYDG